MVVQKGAAMSDPNMSEKQVANRERLSSAPTGDDDSVTHAWETVPVSVIVDADRGIAPLVTALNKIPGVRTFASCEGHPHSTTGNTKPYVMLYVGDVEQANIVARAIETALEAPAQPAQEQTHWGNLWLCYHALKFSEWGNINDEPHDCAYCGQRQEIGHHADCMIGNALKWIANQSAQPAQDDVERAREVLTCLFCGEPADHKCGDDRDCGNCCAMRGGLAHQDEQTYKWLHDIVRPHLKRLKEATSQTADIESQHVAACKEICHLQRENERLQAALTQLLEALKGDQHVPKLYVDMLEQCISPTGPPTPPEAKGFHS